LNLHEQVGDLLMTQPLAVLNDEEMHWLNDLGLPNQRRWLNHRTLGDEHRRTFPSAATEYSINGHEKAQKAQKEDLEIRVLYFVTFVPFCG
jgi:hypothetical protein